MFIINREMKSCATCIHWGGGRRVVSYNDREIEVFKDEGPCYKDGVNEDYKTGSSYSCNSWIKY